MQAVELKQCVRCERNLPLSSFPVWMKRGRPQIVSRCMDCDRKRHRDRYDSEQSRDKYLRGLTSDPEATKAKWRKAAAKRRQCPQYRLRNRIGPRITQLLRGGKGGANLEAVLGYTIPDLAAHLERQFVDGMAWENMGEWHIDHVVPLSSFAISGVNDPELRRAWGLPNLRPLWAADNMRKSARRETLL